MCELLCGRGGDISPYLEAKIRKYIGVDPNKEDINVARLKWNDQSQTYVHFVQADPFKIDLFQKLRLDKPTANLFDVVTSQPRLFASLGNPYRTAQLFDNISNLLNPEGYFIGYTIDPDVIQLRLQEQGLSLTHPKISFPHVIEFP